MAPSACVERHGVPRRGEALARDLRGRVSRTEVLRGGAEGHDLVAVEEPLEIRIAGETVAVLMRTPGDDQRLAIGFLFSERIISSAADVASVYHCGRAGAEGHGNTIEVAPASGARIDWERLDGARRSVAATSACGVCGRRTVADLLAGLPRPPPGPVLSPSAISAGVEALRAHQPAFGATGGTHCAALFARDGELLAAHEDVGRHNAVDKVVGALLLARNRGSGVLHPGLLAVSSRAGLEVLQKAARAGVPIVASVSAPTSLAVQLAREAGVTLAAFVREGRMNVYSMPGRIAG